MRYIGYVNAYNYIGDYALIGKTREEVLEKIKSHFGDDTNKYDYDISSLSDEDEVNILDLLECTQKEIDPKVEEIGAEITNKLKELHIKRFSVIFTLDEVNYLAHLTIIRKDEELCVEDDHLWRFEFKELTFEFAKAVRDGVMKELEKPLYKKWNLLH